MSSPAGATKPQQGRYSRLQLACTIAIAACLAFFAVVYFHDEPQFLRLDGHRSGINAVAYSPDGSQIATSGDDRSVKLWSSGGQQNLTLGVHTNRVTSLTFSSAGDRLFSGDGDGVVRIWDVATGLEVDAFDAHADSIEAMTISSDGTRLYTVAWDAKLKVWDSGSGKLQNECQLPAVAERCVLLPDESALLVGCIDGRIRKVVLAGTPSVQNLFDAHEGAVKALRLDADGSVLASVATDHTVKLWNLRTASLEGSVRCPSRPFDVIFCRDGQHLLCGTRKGTLLKVSRSKMKIDETMSTPLTAIRMMDHDGAGNCVAGGYKALAIVFADDMKSQGQNQQSSDD